MNGNIKGVIFNAALIVFLKAIILFYTEIIFAQTGKFSGCNPYRNPAVV